MSPEAESGPGEPVVRPSRIPEGFSHDPRVYLAIHPADAERIFSSQSSYGKNLRDDFRENVKALHQVYVSIQRYLQGIFRREESYYPELDDIYKDLQIYKRSVSDKIPMPSPAELLGMCLQLASQDPPFIHVIRELVPGPKDEIAFKTMFAAPTEKHLDKVIVAYRSALDTSLKNLRNIITGKKFGPDYDRLYSSLQKLSDVPYKTGRVDEYLKQVYISEPELGTVRQHDLVNLQQVNRELYKRIFKPLMIAGVREKLVLSFSNADVRQQAFPGADKTFDLTLFNLKTHIQNRYDALSRLLQPKLDPDLIDRAVYEDLQHKVKMQEMERYDAELDLATRALEKALSAPNVEGSTINFLLEIQHLAAWLKTHGEKLGRQDAEDELHRALKRIRDHGNLMRGRSSGKWNINEDILTKILQGRIPHVLACTDPWEDLAGLRGQEINLDDYDHVYLLYKDRKITAKAIETAIELYEKVGDTQTLHVIENILGLGLKSEEQLKEYVAPAYIDRLQICLRQAYVGYLPFWQRLWIKLTSADLKERQLQKIRSEKRIVSNRKLKRKHGLNAAGKPTKETIQKAVREKAEAAQLSAEENRHFKDIVEFLNNAWADGHYPSAPEIAASTKEHSDEYRKLIGLIDAGAASVAEVVAIANSAETVYGSRTFIKQHRDEIIAYMENKLQNEQATIQHMNRTLTAQNRGTSSQRREVYKAILNFVKLRA
ncbi:MAG: hypothetical protein KDK39_09555 [Leptospiraceae bacterium]|nr:hypothetical protein [Leptospiraceae bacterium]